MKRVQYSVADRAEAPTGQPAAPACPEHDELGAVACTDLHHRPADVGSCRGRCDDELRREEYLRQMARRLRVDEWTLRREFRKTPNRDEGRAVRLGDATAPPATVVGVAGTARFRDLTTNLGASSSEPATCSSHAPTRRRERRICARVFEDRRPR